ncbi:MAG: hypothetical protein QNL70_05110 [Pseudomonas sp.]
MGKIDKEERAPAAARTGFLWIAISFLVLILTAYWWLLINSQRSQLAHAKQQLELPAQ